MPRSLSTRAAAAAKQHTTHTHHTTNNAHIITKQATFFRKLQAVAARHLAATLRLLEPANSLPVWSVTIDAKAVKPSEESASNAANLIAPTPLKLSPSAAGGKA